MSEHPFRDLVVFARGGGWGSDTPLDDHDQVSVIRGTDFASVRTGRVNAVPRRWEKRSKLAQRVLRPGDVVLEISGGSAARGQTTGRTLFIGEKVLSSFADPVIPASFCRVVRFDTTRVEPRYAYYGLQDMYHSGRAGAYENQSTGISNFQFERFLDAERLRVPPLAEQQRIIALLSSIDDKISVNDQIATTADTLRSALLQAAHQRRPDDFVAQPLSQVAEFVNGRAFTKDATGKGRMVVRIAEINSGPGPSTVYNDITVDEKHLARAGDVLFSWSGSLAVARWFRPEAIINQHIFKVIPRGDNPKWLAFEAVKSKIADYRAIAADKATTMGHIQRRHLDEEVWVPARSAVEYLDPQAEGLWQRALVAEQESLTLLELRHRLLPELMSGRLRVRDAEKVAEEAV
ncbi:restriction endonuclease subunit S [Micromonospora sp. NPDC052213]|uniref:restriction endonuclease subunit S n=1 Tax=Micromonospora sp. NPDC052213 TaxID=3155812 RepID=UPI003439C4F3